LRYSNKIKNLLKGFKNKSTTLKAHFKYVKAP
jgi:hypothetical protein